MFKDASFEVFIFIFFKHNMDFSLVSTSTGAEQYKSGRFAYVYKYEFKAMKENVLKHITLVTVWALGPSV